MLRRTASINEAARQIGVSWGTITNWKRYDPEYAAAIKDALEEYKDQVIFEVREAARTGKDVHDNNLRNPDTLLKMFICKQLDPSFRDTHKLIIDTGQGLKQATEDIKQEARQIRLGSVKDNRLLDAAGVAAQPLSGAVVEGKVAAKRGRPKRGGGVGVVVDSHNGS